MKKSILMATGLIMLLAISNMLTAQNTYPWPSNGYVGIGTTSPQNLLDVRGGSIYTNGSMQVDGGDLYLSRTSDSYGYVVRPNVAGYRNLGFTIAGGGFLDNLQVWANTSFFTGNVGVGNSSPGSKLDVYWPASSNPQNILLLHSGSFGTAANAANSYFMKMVDDGSGVTQFIVKGDGSVGLGTSNTQGYTLAVNGSAIFTRAVVKLYANWPDDVFKKEYRLPSLDSVARYIKNNNHLPEMPAAAEVEKNGIDLGGNQALMLKKIEELTLYIIEQNKRISRLEKQVAGTKKR